MANPSPTLPEVQIGPDRAKSILAGHPWIFSGALVKKPQVPDGALVRVAAGKRFLGIGYYNGRTDIAVRLLTRADEAIDAAFFAARFKAIRARKEAWLPPRTDAYRAVFGEGDGLPGLVVDRYADTLVAQFHTAGMDALRPQVLQGLLEAHSPDSVVERSDVGARRAEGLEPLPPALLHGPETREVLIVENGFRFAVDVMEGQKTGFFLDQRENRQALLRWCAGRTVLNCFSYSGGFSVYAASAAKRAVSVDISKAAVALARRNFELNGLPAPEGDFVARDVFEHLKAIAPGEFDLILLDPPSFAKNRRQLPNAIKAYTSLNAMALDKLPEGGILVSSSCTSHVDQGTFIKILHQSGVLAGCSLRVLDSREQPFDHPYHLSFPEGRYLKFFVLQKGPL
jgi:23S rRNA (cytosine1962-C5)-methyltransferase